MMARVKITNALCSWARWRQSGRRDVAHVQRNDKQEHKSLYWNLGISELKDSRKALYKIRHQQ
jgi:hypothetical protein